jgi:hypothetical protein
MGRDSPQLSAQLKMLAERPKEPPFDKKVELNADPSWSGEEVINYPLSPYIVLFNVPVYLTVRGEAEVTWISIPLRLSCSSRPGPVLPRRASQIPQRRASR